MNQDPLWPFGTRMALVASITTWLLTAILFAITATYLGWPDDQSAKLATLIVVALGLLPIGLRLLDFAAACGAKLDIKGVKIDFSGVDLDQPQVKRETPGIPDNIGVSGPIVSDTTPMDIIRTLEEVARSEIVVIDLKGGEAWWVTRLLALSAGAVRAGAPKTLVFVGQKQNRDRQYLGWAAAGGVLESILRDKDDYRARYNKAMRIAQQVFMFGGNDFLPHQTDPPEAVVLHNDVSRYTNLGNTDNKNFVKLGLTASEQILMDQLANTHPGPSLEAPPDRLNLGRLNGLFGHCLNTEGIDLGWPREKQVVAILESTADYIALVRAGRYDSMMTRADGERLLLRELILPSKQQ